MKSRQFNKKYISLLIGFLCSWVVSIFLFYPQPIQYGWFATAISVLFFGFSWIVPITFLLLYFSKGKTLFRRLISSKIFTFLLYSTLTLALIVSWKFKFSYDIIIIGFWILVTLTWINIYLNMKRLIIEKELKAISKVNSNQI